MPLEYVPRAHAFVDMLAVAGQPGALERLLATAARQTPNHDATQVCAIACNVLPTVAKGVSVFVERWCWQGFVRSPAYAQYLLCAALCTASPELDRSRTRCRHISVTARSMHIGMPRVHAAVGSVAGVAAFLAFVEMRNAAHLSRFWMDATRLQSVLS